MSTPLPPQVDFELETYELVLFRQTRQAGETDPPTVERLLGQHIAYALSLRSAGKLVLAGAISDGPDEEEPVSGIGLFRTGSLEETKALLDADPAVAAGIERVDVMTFRTRKGAFRFGDLE